MHFEDLGLRDLEKAARSPPGTARPPVRGEDARETDEPGRTVLQEHHLTWREQPGRREGTEGLGLG